jgi:photosystem II stability/assembly factor-like uncharacterized protein
MKSTRTALVLTLLLLFAVTMLSFAQASKAGKAKPQAPPETKTPEAVMLKGLKARSIGPAIMGGRVSAIALDPVDIYTYYVGLGTGGVMKTTNNGATFSAIFEKEGVAAIGAIAVAPSNAKHVWVGTGEANDRNSSSWGDGVYHSTDAGSTWTNVGLKESKTIARIAVDPKDTNTVYVAAMGDLWNPNPERGLYKTVDGGKTWKAILTAPKGYENRVGCGDVVLDPSDPNVVYAALYARRRTPWSFSAGPEWTDGKDLGGIFKSTDGGATWKKLEGGLPPGTGRIGLAIFLKNPKILYAVVQSDEAGTSSIDEVESKLGGVFRTDDGGEHWTRMNRLDPRPFYFSQIRVDPENDKRVYVLGFMLHVSDDGGKSFQEDFFKNVHSDCHELAIDPRHPKRIILGTDGGAYQSFDGGKLWQFLNKFAAGEFYRITVDMSTPYRIAGGLQDNLNWVGPSMTQSKEGIRNYDWTNIGGGDGFYCVFDPFDSTVIYAESQEGYVHRFNLRTGEIKGLRPEPEEGQPAFRFHWNSPLIPSLHEKGTMYLGGNRVFKLTDHGEHWKTISPDLSAQQLNRIMTVGSGAENYGVVYALAESPVKAGMLWAGTDDGKLWVTRDGGASWTDLTEHLPKAVKGQWIGRIEPGHFDAEVAYMTITGYPGGIYQPLAYRTADGGKTWSSIAGDLPPNGPVKVVREDLKNPDLLFAGTEFGLFVSFDRGVKWVKFGELPTVSVDDIVIHPREHDLVVATHGRSLYILDDITPLEELTPEVQSKPVSLFPPRPAFGYYPFDGWVDSGGGAVYRGANPPLGAIISFYVKEYTGDAVKVSITNSEGRTVANLSAPGTPGFGRVSWDLKPTKDLLNDYGGQGQKFMSSGDYTVTLTYGKLKETQKVRVNIAAGIETR